MSKTPPATFLIVHFLSFIHRPFYTIKSYAFYVLWFYSKKVVNLLKLNASTTTRSTTRCSGDLMGDQITDVTRSLLGDQIDDQISLSRIDSEWSCCLLGKYQGLLNKCELHWTTRWVQATRLGDQIFTFWSH